MSEAERASLGYLVLVMRRWPQGFSWEALGLHLWLPDAGPSPELLKAYQAKQIDWEEFAQRYRVEPGTIRWVKETREGAKARCLRSSTWMNCADSTVLSRSCAMSAKATATA